MTGLTVAFPWKPHAKQRPRGKAGQRSYTPKVTKDAEKMVRENFLKAVGDDFKKFDGPIAVVLNLADHAVKLEVVTTDPHTGKKLRGDVDNYAKTILDALNGVAWVDDKQIRLLLVAKL